MRRCERERLARKAAYQAERPLVLPMGEPHNCFMNSIMAVVKYPARLKYCEGFYILPIPEVDKDYVVFQHHAWVVDKVTGQRHELTIRQLVPDCKYVGKVFDLSDHPKPANEYHLKTGQRE
jgi:hypothetical protein